MLAGALIESIVKTPATYRATRTVVPSSDSEPMYVFLLLPHTNSSDYDKYRDLRRHMLYSYCMIAKLAHQDARDIIGLATESGQGMYRSEDIVYLDGRDWDEELLLEAVRIREEFVAQGWLKEHEYSHAHVKEYPDIAK